MLDQILDLIGRAIRRIRGIPSSSTSARERLKFVLVQDRSSLPAKTLEAMKNDLVEVISKYVAIDKESIEFEIKRSGSSIMLVSNIPLMGAQKPPSQGRSRRAQKRRAARQARLVE